MFISTASSSPNFGYPKPLKDSSSVPQTYFEGGLGLDGTTPISSGSSQYGAANQPDEKGFAQSNGI